MSFFTISRVEARQRMFMAAKKRWICEKIVFRVEKMKERERSTES